jgi:prolipoprotein diacylglyceryltransferase
MIPYSPTPVLDLLGMRIPVEAVAMNAAFVLFSVYLIASLRRQGLDLKSFPPKDVARLIILVLLCALAGGRIWYYASHWKGVETLLTMFDLRKQGLVSAGMIIGGGIGFALYFLHLRRQSSRFAGHMWFDRFVDAAAPAAALSFFVYRLFGCAIFGDVVGKETAVPWALFWTAKGVARHPVAFYFALGALLIFLLLRMFLGHEKKLDSRFGRRFDGEAVLWFLVLYSLSAFWIEFFRFNREMFGPLNLVQWFCVAIFLASVPRLAYRYWRIRRARQDYRSCNRLVFGRSGNRRFFRVNWSLWK